MKGRLLLVDDERPILFAMREYLALADYEVDTAETVDEALAQLATAVYDLAIVDLRLGAALEPNGLEVVRAARARHPHMHIVILTAYREPEIEREVLRLGIDRALNKPQPMRTIAQLIGGLLQPPIA